MPTTIDGGGLKKVADDAVVNVAEILLSTEAFSISVNTEGLEENDNIQVFVAGTGATATAYDRSSNNYMTDNGAAHAWKPLSLDTHLKSTFSLRRSNYHRLNASQVAAIAKTHVSKIAAAAIKTAFDKITGVNAQNTANFPNEIDAGAALNFDQSVVSKAETELAKLVGIGGERNLILNLDFFDGLRNNLTGLYANPTNNETLRSGVIPGLAGFASTVRSSAIASAVPGVKSLVGLATNKTGIAMGFAAVRPVSDFDGDWEVSIDPVTKIPFTFSTDYSKDNRDLYMTVELLSGVAVLDGKGILRLTSTPPSGS